METKILLCCLNPTIDINMVDEMSIYEIFKEYAVVKNVKIFSRDVLIKAFVEVESEFVEPCIEKTHLHGCPLGKLKVYLSHKDNITFDKDLNTIISESAHGMTTTSQMNSQNFQNSDAHSFSYQNRNSNYLIDKSKKSKIRFSNALQSFENLDEVFEEDVNIDYKNIKSVTNINDRQYDMIKYYPVSLENIHTINSFQFKQNESSKVLIINRIKGCQVNCQMLMNIFGCFGNVKKVLLNTKANFALVEMEDSEQTIEAIKHLNNIMFFGNSIKVKCSKYSTVSLKTVEKEQNPDIQFLRGHYKYFRYKEESQIKINKPSNLLHVTSLSEKFNPYLLCQLLSQIHEPSKIVRLDKNSSTSNAYLVEFESANQAIEVLSVLHNKKVDGKVMKISFSDTDVGDIN